MNQSYLQRVYVWQLPVRFYHWINAICVLALAVTGYLIGSPPALKSSAEAYAGYWFGTIRAVHFIAAFVFFFNFVVRIYWGFVGNQFAKWDQFILHRKEQLKEVADVLRVDILQSHRYPLPSIGHNALAGLTYFVSFLAFLFQCITGFGLYSAMSHSRLPDLFEWVIPLMGGDFAVRQYHHLMMWFFIIFAMIHTYLVFYHDYVEGRGVTSSMVGGWKFIEPSEAPKGK
jgi:Ni/Fe-hydrogenase 1 B-type cytochrome subunit